MDNTPIQRAVDIAGGQATLARRINASYDGYPVSQQLVWYWVKTGMASPLYCRDIEKVTGVTKEELRPDIFQDD